MRKGLRPLGVVLSVAAAAVLAGPASAAPPTNTQALQDAVKVGDGSSGIRRHLREFQIIADANNGTRDMEFSGNRSVTNAPVAVIGFAEHDDGEHVECRLRGRRLPPGATGLAGKVAVIQRGTRDFGAEGGQRAGARRRGRDHLQ